MFQFPLHRDPRCNCILRLRSAVRVRGRFSSLYIGILAATSSAALTSSSIVKFQFPLHRDPRCNLFSANNNIAHFIVSVPFTSGSSLQHNPVSCARRNHRFQFPLHRDPRCNRVVLKRRVRSVHIRFSSLYIGILAATLYVTTLSPMKAKRFSSLYIGILAATGHSLGRGVMERVSVPFTSGSSLQLILPHFSEAPDTVSVPFTSGSSLQLSGIQQRRASLFTFQFPLHRDPRCN